MTDQTPKEAGWYFARLRGWTHFAPVEFRRTRYVLQFGSTDIWSASDFTWGPRITLPDELEGVK